MQIATANDLLVIQALGYTAGKREVSYTYLLMDSMNTVIGDVTDSVISCSVDMNSNADINRSAKFEIADNNIIDFAKDRIQPWCHFNEAQTAGWPLGVFLLSSGGKHTSQTGKRLRDADGYDLGLIPTQDVDGGPLGVSGQRYTVQAGVRYTMAVRDILNSYATLGIPFNNVIESTKTLPVAKDWEPGTSVSKIIGELLSAINYFGLYFDEMGVAQCSPYQPPANRASEYTYSVDRTSILFPEANRQIDLFEVPNKWIRIVSEPDRPVLVGTYTNTDPASLTSTVARGRTITDFATGADAPDQATLDLQVLSLAIQASQIYEHFDFETAINPLHSFADVYTITFPDLGLSNLKYSEQKWSMELKAGARMKHSARRAVSLS